MPYVCDQGDPTIICVSGDLETIRMGDRYLAVPATVDALQGVLTIIPMQLLSLHVAELRKLDVCVTPS